MGRHRHTTLESGANEERHRRGRRGRVFFRAVAEAIRVSGVPRDVIDLDENSPMVRHLRSSGDLRRVG